MQLGPRKSIFSTGIIDLKFLLLLRPYFSAMCYYIILLLCDHTTGNKTNYNTLRKFLKTHIVKNIVLPVLSIQSAIVIAIIGASVFILNVEFDGK